MPVILPRESYEGWLNGSAGKEVLIPCPADQLKAQPVSTHVNSPRNDDPQCIEPVAAE